jgi:hypothetical protein
LSPLYKLLRPGDLLGDRPSRFHVRTQRPTEYRIGGVILVHMSGTNHSHENAHFSGGANELRTLDKERAQPRWWRRPPPWPSGDRWWKEPAKSAPNTTMNSNLDAKLVGAMQSEIDLRCVSFRGKNSQKFNRQSF